MLAEGFLFLVLKLGRYVLQHCKRKGLKRQNQASPASTHTPEKKGGKFINQHPVWLRNRFGGAWRTAAGLERQESATPPAAFRMQLTIIFKVLFNNREMGRMSFNDITSPG